MFCTNCRAWLPDETKYCSQCSTPVQRQRSAPPPAEKKKSRTVATLILVIGAAAFLAFFLFVVSNTSGSSGETRRTYSFGTGNPTAERLLNLPAFEQRAILAQDISEGCVGAEAYYMGVSAEHEAFWSLRCSGGTTSGNQSIPAQIQAFGLLGLRSRQNTDVRQVAVIFRIIQPVADDEFVGNREPDVIHWNRLYPPLRLVE